MIDGNQDNVVGLSTKTADFDRGLRRHWIQLPASDPTQAAELRERLGVDFTAPRGRVWETDDFLYLPVVVNFSRAGTIERAAMMFAIGSDYLVTLQPAQRFAPFDKAIAKMRRHPELVESPHGIMYALRGHSMRPPNGSSISPAKHWKR